MRKKGIAGVLSMLLAVSLTACGLSAEPNVPRNTATQDQNAAQPATNASQETPSEQTAPSQNSTIVSMDDALPSELVRSKQVQLKGDGTDTVTMLVYMNGSNLETDDQEATIDLSEMVAAGSSDNVNVIVQTMGTKKWDSKFGISNTHTQIYSLDGNGMTLVKDDLGQLDCTVSSTLANFIVWGVQNYPADRYILQFWDHGGGPVYGFGVDEYQGEDECLSLDEIQAGLRAAGVYFDFIGMDCCIMSCLEVAVACYDYCDYMILSEDFESGLGWSYTGWMKQLYQNSSTDTPTLAKTIIDDFITANETNSEWGDESIMALVDESKIKVLYKAWTDFAYANEQALLNQNYSTGTDRKKGDRISPLLVSRYGGGYYDDWYDDDSSDDPEMSDYYITDIMAVASNIDSQESKVLESALANTLAYVKSTAGDAYLTGMAVTLPYGDSSFYNDLKSVLANCGFDSAYADWLASFVRASGYSDYYDYDDFYDSWDGWDDYYDDYDWDDYYYDEDDYDYDWDDWGYEDSYNEWYDSYYDDWYSDWDQNFDWDDYYDQDEYDYNYDDYYYDDDDYYYYDDDYYYSDDYDWWWY